MFDVAIIGCGVVGASIAYQLSKYNLKIAVLEKENDVAIGTTKANSAILHAGYDPLPNTLMAKLNVQGNILTKEICKKLDVKCNEVGSLVVAFSPEEMEKIHTLYQRGIENGVPNLQILSKQQLFEKEPDLASNAVGALYAPSAAICEPWDLCLAMAQTAVINGVNLFLENRVTYIEKTENGYKITTDKDVYYAKTIFNAAGINSDDIHNMIAPVDFKILPHSGQYYLLDKSQGSIVNHIIFQCPVGDTKGVLVAPTVHGNLIAGPDSNDNNTTATDSQNLAFVRTSAAKSVPNIDFRQNIRNFSGIRATSDHEDFIIKEIETAKGFFDLAGIKSPGLTAAAAIGILCVDFIKNFGFDLMLKENYIDSRKKIRFNQMSASEKAELINQDRSYAKVICRCETVTEGEIIHVLNQPIPPVSLDGVKRRTSAGMGRCQGGFCGPRVLEIIAKHTNTCPLLIPQEKASSYILTAKTKEN